MTSLRGMTVDKRMFLRGFKHKLLPVSPTPKHSEHGIQLHLQNGRLIDRDISYVATHQRYWVDYDHLQRYRDGPCTFTEESLQIMIRHSGFEVAQGVRSTPDKQLATEHPPEDLVRDAHQISERWKCFTGTQLNFYRESPLTQPSEDMMKQLEAFRSFVDETRII
jgi:hypothetical protein